MYLRKCESKDCDILYKWANDPTVRVNAFNTSSIPYSNHVEWFNNSLNLENRIIFICMSGENAVGQIRVDIDNGKGTISYVVDKDSRGIGIGSKMLNMLYDIIVNEYNNIKELIGLVKKGNIASKKAFLSNGYDEVENKEYMTYTIEIK